MSNDIRQQQIAAWTGLSACEVTLRRYCDRQFLAIVASHLHKNPEFSAAWRQHLRSAILLCEQRKLIVLYCLQNPLGYWIKTFAEKFDVESLCVELPTSVQSRSEKVRCNTLFFQAKPSTEVTVELQRLPLPDRLILALADHVAAIELKRGSKTEKLLQHWQANQINANKGGTLYLAETKHSKRSSVADLSTTRQLPSTSSGSPSTHREQVPLSPNRACCVASHSETLNATPC